MTKDNFSICWIDVGRNLPCYLRRNILLHREMYPDLKQYLITDRNPKTKIASSELVLTEQLAESTRTVEFNDLTESKKIPYEQKNFWVLTTKRFFLLYDFMLNHELERVLHLESDNIILNLKSLSGILGEIPRGLAFPMQSKSEGCGSVFYVADLDSLGKFLDFILKRWTVSEENDMTLLGNFAEKASISVLPSRPSGKLIIDPGAYGKYFIGSDARNFRLPMRKRGIITGDPTSLLRDMNGLNFKLLDFPTRLVIKDNNEGEILNLHIHSKDIPKNVRQLRRVLSKSFVSRGHFWRFGSFDFLVASERILSKFNRIFGRKEVRLR